jgi:hypothetical protein
MSCLNPEKRGEFVCPSTHNLRARVSSAMLSQCAKNQRYMMLTESDCRDDSRFDAKNVGAQVTRLQQVKILLSTSLAAFTVVGKVFLTSYSYTQCTSIELTSLGFSQAFGVFQAYYTRKEAVKDGIVRVEEMDDRALASAIGSLGNGGIVAIFAALYYPHLPRIGIYVRYLCSIGTGCIVLGLATAAASRSVSVSDLQ